MKKLLPLLLLPFLLGACSNSASSPVIEVKNLYINGDETVDYARDMESMPLLQKDDEVTISLKLDGKGEDLNTFLVQEDEAGGAASMKITFVDLADEYLSGDKEFTDKTQGKLGFKDGVPQIDFKLSTKVYQVINNEVSLKLYLFSKPVDCEGAKLELKLQMKKETMSCYFR